MRVVSVTVLPNPPVGGINLHCSSPRGGRSTVGSRAMTPETVAEELARRIVNDRQWCTGMFDAKVNGANILIICMPEVANVLIYTDPENEGALTIAEWGS